MTNVSNEKSSRSDASWSFTLRGGCQSDSDDDEDDGLGSTSNLHTKSSTTQSSDAQLLKDLDISTREDTAKFISNPWSIAKVNAASNSRPSNSYTTSKATSTDIPAAISSVKKDAETITKGPIVEGFKKQLAKQCSNKLKVFSQPRSTLISIQKSPAKAKAIYDASSAVEPQTEDYTVRKPYNRPLTPLSNGMKINNGSTASVNRWTTNNARKATICASYSSPAHHYNTTHSPRGAIPSLSSPFRPSDRPIPKVSVSSDFRHLPPCISPMNNSTYRNPMLSECNTTSLILGDYIDTQNTALPLFYRRNNVHPKVPAEPTSYKNTERGDTAISSHMYDRDTYSGPVASWQASYDPPRQPRQVTPRVSQNMRREEFEQREVFRVGPTNSIDEQARTPLSRSNRCRAPRSPSPLPSPSSSPPPAPKKHMNFSQLRYQKKNAYDAHESDELEDTAWSTLPPRKKPRKDNKDGAMRQSGRFRLPLASYNKNAADSASMAGKRVITYLPPPAKEHTPQKDNAMKPASSWTIKRAQADRLDALSEQQRKRSPTEFNDDIKATGIGSDPDSDATLVQTSSPMNKQQSGKTGFVSVDKLSESYPQLRRDISEVIDWLPEPPASITDIFDLTVVQTVDAECMGFTWLAELRHCIQGWRYNHGITNNALDSV